MKLSDVPLIVIEQVRNEWSKALETGWNEELWTACELCIINRDCHDCPLYEDEWCKETGKQSRITIWYHHNNKHAWHQDVYLFVEMLNTEITRRANNVRT